MSSSCSWSSSGSSIPSLSLSRNGAVCSTTTNVLGMTSKCGVCEYDGHRTMFARCMSSVDCTHLLVKAHLQKSTACRDSCWCVPIEFNENMTESVRTPRVHFMLDDWADTPVTHFTLPRGRVFVLFEHIRVVRGELGLLRYSCEGELVQGGSLRILCLGMVWWFL